MELRFLIYAYGILSLPLIITANRMNEHYGESYHLTVCCTHLTGRHARNTNCCMDQESDPWGVCSSVCQVERLNLRAPLRNTTLRGSVPVKDNNYQVLDLTVVTAVRYINISVEMNWVARPGRKCTQRDLCEFDLCVKDDPDNATKCIANLITVIQLHNEHIEDEANESEVTESVGLMVAAGARTINFQAADHSTTEMKSVYTTSPLLLTKMTSRPVVDQVSTAVNFQNAEVTSSQETYFEESTTTTTTTMQSITEQDNKLTSPGLHSSTYSVNFVVGTACGLMGGAMLTAVIVFLCWIKTGNRYPKLNSKGQCEVVLKNKIQPMANPFYSLSVPDIIGMVADSQHNSEPVYAQIGPVDSLASHNTSSDCNTEVTTGNTDVASESYNTLNYMNGTMCNRDITTRDADVIVNNYHTLNYTPNTLPNSADVVASNADVTADSYNTLSYTPGTTLPFNTYNRLDLFLRDCSYSDDDAEEMYPGYDTVYGAGVQSSADQLTHELDDDYDYCVVNDRHTAVNQNYSTSRRSVSIVIQSDSDKEVSKVTQSSELSVNNSRFCSSCEISRLLSRRSDSEKVVCSGQQAHDYANVANVQSVTDVIRTNSDAGEHRTQNMDNENRQPDHIHACSDSRSDTDQHLDLNTSSESEYDCQTVDSDHNSSNNSVMYFVLECIDQVDV